MFSPPERLFTNDVFLTIVTLLSHHAVLLGHQPERTHKTHYTRGLRRKIPQTRESQSLGGGAEQSSVFGPQAQTGKPAERIQRGIFWCRRIDKFGGLRDFGCKEVDYIAKNFSCDGLSSPISTETHRMLRFANTILCLGSAETGGDGGMEGFEVLEERCQLGRGYEFGEVGEDLHLDAGEEQGRVRYVHGDF
ncbi:hypothetical protein RUND412_002897 [Rhizina undulata]